MNPIYSHRRAGLVLSAAVAALMAGAGAAQAQDAGAAASSAQVTEVVVTATRTTRSAVALEAPELQKILPGVNPLKAIQTLPGVLYVTADPWGNNEQNESLFVHGFSTQQLGYTFDNVPLGDQQYGNYNGLSPSRAVSSENVSRVTLESGAGSLGVASTSNLGGAIETFSRDPSKDRTFNMRETGGSYGTNRTFVRLDTGEFDGNSGYVSFLHHDARAWDFNGHQKDNQANLKFVHQSDAGKFTAFFDWDDKVEPNEDATAFGNQQTATSTYFPATRPFLYPNLAACSSTLTNGSPPVAQGNNFSNCFSAAQRTDALAYLKYDADLTSHITWSNQVYYHYNYGRGIVAGPINQAGLPALFATYYPQLVVDKNGNHVPVSQAAANATTPGSLAAISALFGGTGNEVRTTEYRDNRGGLLSTVHAELGDHQLEAGLWWEHNEDAQHRVWYPFSAANNDLSPYDVPNGQKVLTQYYATFVVNDVQLHLQDQWRIRPDLLLQAGFKSSLQDAKGKFPINQQNLPGVASPTHYPTGSITSNMWFLPQIGLLWDITDHEHVFVNVQKNMRQFIPYGAGSNFYGFSPWSLGSQAAFDLFKQTVHPETSWTYEAGLRSQRAVDLGPLTAVSGQAELYHVNFQNRLLNIAAYNFINPGAAILANVGGVTTNGVDLAGTFEFGQHFQVYDAVSYNKSTYDSDYQTGSASGAITNVAIGGKWVPLTPDWMNKTIASTTWGNFEAQVSGDYVGRRYVTYFNDLAVSPFFIVGLEASYRFEVPSDGVLKAARISANVTNLFNEKGISTAVVTGNSVGYQGFPIAPRMGFVTLDASF